MSNSATSTAQRIQFKPALPFLDLKAQFAGIREEVMQAITRVMDSQHFILGPEVQAFENETAQKVGAKYAIGCASGSDALVLALMALGVGAGDEVITVPFTFVATAGSIARVGATPKFVDIDPVTYNLEPTKLEAAITPKTKAIIPVHLFGLAADMDAINAVAAKHGIPVIEDAAQAIGARYQGRAAGSLATMCCFSFFPSKNLGGAGDGGMVTTNDDRLADRLKVLRVHGSRRKYEYELVGMNSRLDAIQAAILRVKAKYLDKWADGRRANADKYRALIAEAGLGGAVQAPVEPLGYHHVYNQFTVRVPKRDALRTHLQAAGIPTEIYYPYPLHTEPAFAPYGYAKGDFPVTEKAASEVLSLPVYPELTEQQLRGVVAAIAEFYAANW
jgi:dTDP-4-amino-4,6-dideoxygalactose transaminase